MTEYKMKPTIAISQKLKDVLDKMKIHSRETYEEVISRAVTGVTDKKEKIQGENQNE